MASRLCACRASGSGYRILSSTTSKSFVFLPHKFALARTCCCPAVLCLRLNATLAHYCWTLSRNGASQIGFLSRHKQSISRLGDRHPRPFHFIHFVGSAFAEGATTHLVRSFSFRRLGTERRNLARAARLRRKLAFASSFPPRLASFPSTSLLNVAAAVYRLSS